MSKSNSDTEPRPTIYRIPTKVLPAKAPKADDLRKFNKFKKSR